MEPLVRWLGEFSPIVFAVLSAVTAFSSWWMTRIYRRQAERRTKLLKDQTFTISIPAELRDKKIADVLEAISTNVGNTNTTFTIAIRTPGSAPPDEPEATEARK